MNSSLLQKEIPKKNNQPSVFNNVFYTVMNEFCNNVNLKHVAIQKLNLANNSAKKSGANFVDDNVKESLPAWEAEPVLRF